MIKNISEIDPIQPAASYAISMTMVRLIYGEK